MSRAEEKGYEAYPIIMHTLIPVHEDMPNIEQNCNVFHRQAYIKGYHQAEKDLELTWEDISKIISIDQQVCGTMGISDYTHNHQQAMEEVLKRFKER